MIKLDAIVRAVEKMTDALNSMAKAINRAVDIYEAEKAYARAKDTVDKIVKSREGTGGFGQGW